MELANKGFVVLVTTDVMHRLSLISDSSVSSLSLSVINVFVIDVIVIDLVIDLMINSILFLYMYVLMTITKHT